MIIRCYRQATDQAIISLNIIYNCFKITWWTCRHSSVCKHTNSIFKILTSIKTRNLSKYCKNTSNNYGRKWADVYTKLQGDDSENSTRKLFLLRWFSSRLGKASCLCRVCLPTWVRVLGDIHNQATAHPSERSGLQYDIFNASGSSPMHHQSAI